MSYQPLHQRLTTDELDYLLAEARTEIVNALDAAMGNCPHENVTTEWDLCNACAADAAVAVVREVFTAERV